MNDFAPAVAAWRAGGLVAFPTETVYGIGADADNTAAVQRLFEVKRRPKNQPITIHLGPSADPAEWGRMPKGAQKLADACWPGPLTLVIPWRSRVPAAITGGRPSVGIRVPDHPVAMALLDAFGGGVAASSANRRGQPPPTTAQGVRAALEGDYDVLVESEPTLRGVASTVLDLTIQPRILRQGGLSRETLQNLLEMAIQPAAP